MANGVDGAVAAGATVLAGGVRNGAKRASAPLVGVALMYPSMLRHAARRYFCCTH